MFFLALSVDINKHITEGKSFILEGIHVQSSYLLHIMKALQSTNKTGIVVPFFIHIKEYEQKKSATCESTRSLDILETSPNTELQIDEYLERFDWIDQSLAEDLKRDFIEIQADLRDLNATLFEMHDYVLRKIQKDYSQLCSTIL